MSSDDLGTRTGAATDLRPNAPHRPFAVLALLAALLTVVLVGPADGSPEPDQVMAPAHSSVSDEWRPSSVER
jgi:hypothetical protein